MLRVIIFDKKMERSFELFQTAQAVVRKFGVKCELSHTGEAEKLLGNIAKDKRYYDVLILNVLNDEALRIARELRKVNMEAAIIFSDGDNAKLNDLLKYRPSAVVNAGAVEAVIRALAFCIGEQVRHRHYFTVRNKEALIRVNFEDISHIESRQRIAVMYAGNKVYEFYAKLGDIYQALPQDEFVRCHQSFIVNMNYVRTLDKSGRCFHLQSGEVIEISKANYAQTLTQYTAYLDR